MEQLLEGKYSLNDLDALNIILGKNGCGKSTLLRELEHELQRDVSFSGHVRYLSPERGGELKYDPSMERNVASSDTWLDEYRRKNQAVKFRQQSVIQYRKLELLVLREIEQNEELRADPEYTFEKTIDRINSLLDNIKIVRADSDFQIVLRSNGEPIPPNDVSSGEAELISLGIESLVFESDSIAGESNILFLDEPDLHLHPDLQTRLAHFLRELVRDSDFQIILATHSTAFLGALHDYESTRIAFMLRGETSLTFNEIGESLRSILPVFGAHPLSNVFNQAPPLLVEGDDDERIWQQAVRSSEGRIKLYPCAAGSIQDLSDFEAETARIISAVYDEAVGYSLRDRDEGTGEIDDEPPIKRYKLNCRAAENLIVTDDVLAALNTTWEEVEAGIESWIKVNKEHPHTDAMIAFQASGFDRRMANLKAIRNDLMGIIGNSRPWEVIVGQSIARLDSSSSTQQYSLVDFLGSDLVAEFVLLEEDD